jgi:mRNA interferase HigB
MHVISRKALREFWGQRPDAEQSLRRWYTVVRHATWRSFADVRATFRSADQVGRCIVFNVSGNRYRIIAAVHYNRGRVYLRGVLTHREYMQGGWKADCGA